ncbi:TPA: hypothetical protein LU109_003539 [Enterobacter hormaechei subsp. xiangfangensis]|nr:hypothetical protein [Enterobacter hormaechei subsp. xiangfangensis]
MLDNRHQVDAYKKLQASPIHTAHSVDLAKQINTGATAMAATVLACKSATITYPATVTPYLNKLTSWSNSLTLAATTCKAFADDMTPYMTPNQMIEYYIGWQCYCKIQGQPDTTPFKVNDAVADTTLTGNLNAARTAINLAALTAAWAKLNTALTPVAATPPATGTTTPALSAQAITDLQTAMAPYDALFTTFAAAIPPVKTLHDQAKDHGDKAKDAFDRAVTVSILQNIASSNILTPALKAIIAAPIYQDLMDSVNGVP